MSKVIHKPNFKSHLSNLSHSLLHRGQKSKDPYNNKRLSSLSSVGLLLKTLGTDKLSTRCSSTFSSYINNSKNLRIAGFSSSFVLLILSALTIYPIVKNLNTAEAAEAKNSTTSLSITSTNSASVELLVKDSSGTFATSSTSQKLNFGVTTDNYAGYKLTLLGKDDSYANLKNSSTNTNLTSISTSSTVTSSSFANGNWGYTLDGTNYRSAPNNTTGYTIDTTSSPNASTAKTYTLGVGAKADYSTKAGTYTNTYVLTAVGNGTPYVIYYKDNTSDSSVANMPTTQDESTTAINVKLSETIPTRTGYTFSKWCDGTVSNDGTSCSGTLYSASASFGIDRTKPVANNTTTLYAVWTPKTYTLNITNNNTASNPTSSTMISFKGSTNITVTPNAGYYLSAVSCPSSYTCTGYTTGPDATGAQTVTVKNNGNSTSTTGGTIEFVAESSIGTLQDFTTSECSDMTAGTTAELKDSRDEQTYTIAKLEDGRCWMTSNLNLAGGTKLDSSGSDVPSGYTQDTPYYTLPSSSNEGFSDSDTAYVYNSNSVACGDNSSCHSYYSWVAATAGGKDSDGNSVTDNGYNAAYSICPKGWKLPASTTSYKDSRFDNNWETGDLYALTTAYGANEGSYADSSSSTGGNFYIQAGPGTVPNFLLGGHYNYGSFYDGGRYGEYWTSTNMGTWAYYLKFGSDFVSSGNSDFRGNGYSVRCVKKTMKDELEYLQDIDATVTSTFPDNANLVLKDSRDKQVYTVTKINGNFWMTRNLAIGCSGSGVSYDSYVSSKNLTSSNSNVSADYTTPASYGHSDTYTEGKIICDKTYGAYYNYYAATASTISGEDNSIKATHDICPTGWHIPTQTEFLDVIYSETAFKPVMSGYYDKGTFQSGGGFWWSATPVEGLKWNRYGLIYNGTSMGVGNNWYKRTYGFFVRCVSSAS